MVVLYETDEDLVSAIKLGFFVLWHKISVKKGFSISSTNGIVFGGSSSRRWV